MRLLSAPLPQLPRHWPDLAPRIRAAVRRNFSALIGNRQPIPARYHLGIPAENSEASIRLQEELS